MEKFMFKFKKVFSCVFVLCLLVSFPILASTGILKNNESVNTLLEKKTCRNSNKLSYYLLVEDFIASFIEIPTTNVSGDSSTIASSYLAGRAPLYNSRNKKVGTCSASFFNMKNADGIFTDISNYISVDNGLIVSWFTPTKLVNLELDSIAHSMVTECLVVAQQKLDLILFMEKHLIWLFLPMMKKSILNLMN